MSLGVEGIPPNLPSTGSTWNEPGVSPVAGLTFAVIPRGGLSIGRRMSFPSRGASAPRSKRPKIEVVIKRRNCSQVSVIVTTNAQWHKEKWDRISMVFNATLNYGEECDA